ncbi:MAG: DUF2783 domain-containing protein [Quisquiliibacterium sp.]
MSESRQQGQADAGKLITTPNLSDPGSDPLWPYSPGDAFYEALIDAHRGLSDEESQLLNCRLILLLANQVGDLSVLRQALQAARQGL